MPARSTRTRTAKDEIMVARTGFISGITGERVVVQLGDRYRADAPIVRALPQYFQPDGMGAIMRPEPVEVEDEPAPVKRPVKMYRAKRSHFSKSGDAVFAFNEGDLIAETAPVYLAMDASARKDYFELVEDET